jgi:excisionase family DNA binding protein
MDELTKKQAAERKQVSVKTIERWIAEGLIEAHRYGPRLVRVNAESLDSLGRPVHPNYSLGVK